MVDRRSVVVAAIGVATLLLLLAIVGVPRIGVVLMLLILPALALVLRGGRLNTDKGRLLLRTGSEQPIPEIERSRILDEEVSEYMRSGFFVRQRTPTTAQLVRPKRFSFLWAFLWLLVFGIGIVVYLIYYAAKQDEGRYVEVDEYGVARATPQVRKVL